MTESILNSTKKNLGLEADYTDFDPDVIMHINSVISKLTQLGIGPSDGFMIEDANAAWSSLIGAGAQLNMVKTFVYLSVRALFDPPTTAHLIAAMERQIAEFEWRISVYRESYGWTPPTGPSSPSDPEETYRPLVDTVYDGGSP